MVTKKFVKSRKVYKLTFEYPAEHLSEINVESISVAGDFNDWHVKANPMTLNLKKQVYQAVVEVTDPGMYQFRYVVNGRIWRNDWNAEGYMSNGYGEDNCLTYVE